MITESQNTNVLFVLSGIPLLCCNEDCICRAKGIALLSGRKRVEYYVNEGLRTLAREHAEKLSAMCLYESLKDTSVSKRLSEKAEAMPVCHVG